MNGGCQGPVEMLVQGHKCLAIKEIGPGQLTHSLEAIINETVLYTWELLEEQIFNVSTTRTHRNHIFGEGMEELTDLFVVIFLQRIHVSNHHNVHFIFMSYFLTEV